MKNPFKKTPAAEKNIIENMADGASQDAALSGGPSPAGITQNDAPPEGELIPKTKKELRDEKKKARIEKRQAKQAKKKAKKALKQTQKQKGKAEKNKPAEKKTKLSREEKTRLKQEKAIASTKMKADILRARVAKRAEKIREISVRKTEKIQLKKAQRDEKKQLKRELKNSKKQFKRELRAEIKDAKKGMPRSKMPFIIIPLAAIILLVSSVYILNSKNIEPFASLKMPALPGFLSSIKLPSFPGIKLPDLPFGDQSAAEKKEEAEKAIEGMFASLSELDFESAKEFVDVSAFDVPADYLSFVDANIVMHAVFDRLTFEIISEPDEDGSDEEDKQENNDDAKAVVIPVNVTAISIRHLMSDYTAESLAFAFANASSDSPASDAEVSKRIAEIFSEVAAKPGLSTVTKEILIRVEDVDGNWMVMPDDELVDALFGGALSAAGDFFVK
jgi:hypothetical protein